MIFRIGNNGSGKSESFFSLTQALNELEGRGVGIRNKVAVDCQARQNRARHFLVIGLIGALLCVFAGSRLSDAQATGQRDAQATGQGEASQAGGQSTGTEAPSQTGAAPTTTQSGGGQTPAEGANTQGQASTGTPNATTGPSNTTSRPGQNGAQNAAAQAARPRATQPAADNLENGRPKSPALEPATPWGDLPSLQDLNAKVPLEAGEPIRRFGSDVFAFGSGNANELPIDLPVGPDYVLGMGDEIVVNMWGGHTARLPVVIDRQGEISLQEAGTISLNGYTIAQAQTAIQKALSAQFQNEHVEISLGRVRTVRIYVVGEVQRPGAYDVSSLSTPLNALLAAGGPTARGSLRVLQHYRGEQLVRTIDLYDFLLHGIRSDSDRLEPGDVIMVPAAGPQVTIEGMVHRPAIYELNGEKSLSQVLVLSGGVLATASMKQMYVTRIVAHERHTMLTLELPSDPAELAKRLSDFKVQGGDEVIVSEILPYNQAAVYLQGHVYRPGKYPYHDGMTIGDLIRSYQDVLPEPSDHAELIRLQPPDYRPETINFDLRDVLVGNNNIPLEPFDVIRIYSRYQVDSPGVTIDGEVLRPGAYPMSQGMTVAGLVKMAGGFKRSAYRDEADLSSYVIENGQKVLVNHSNVAIERALEGDKNADVLLKPGDVVSIRSLAGWQDIGASVTINGEVEHAGSYGIVDGERLSSVLKRAGGFRRDAYPPAAVLERVQVRELNEQARQEMIQRIENTPIEFKPGTMNEQAAGATEQGLQQEREQALAALRNHPASGRMVINISTDIAKWENTPADIELRSGDTLYIPKRPSFVIVSGQVFNPIAISYVPGERLGWYLSKAGNATPQGDKKHIYVLRADGSVTPWESEHGTIWMSNSEANLRMQPGDTVFVPEKIVGVSQVWQNILGAAQIMTAAALPLAISGVL